MGARLGKPTCNMGDDERRTKKEAEKDSESDGKSSASGDTTCNAWKQASDKSKKKKKTQKAPSASKKDFFGKRNKKWSMKSGKREVDTESPPSGSLSCVCTAYKRRNSEEPVPVSGLSVLSVIDLNKFDPTRYPIDDEDERLRRQRVREIAEGLDVTLQDVLHLDSDNSETVIKPHSQIDYMHCLVPDLKEITNCSFYWGKIDRYEAERLLDGKPEGTFLLRDSAQEEYLFSVSFRRYGRSLHARIEQWNHQFSFDSHDPAVFSSKTVTGLIEHYKDPLCCMFFEPLLTTPLHRNFTFDLQHLARSVISSRVKYDSINTLPLPNKLKEYCQEYHYKQRIKYRRL